jgi:hypothetical protein
MRLSFVRHFLTPVSARARRARRRLLTPDAHLSLELLEDRYLLSSGVALTPGETAPQLVGGPITWTAAVPDAVPGLVYQFRAGSPSEGRFSHRL